MNNEFTQTTLNQSSQKPTPANALRSARETLGLSTADIANQLNLTVNIVERIEANQFSDIAPIFVRGYIRSYAKLVKLSEEATQEIVSSVVDKETSPLSSPRLQTTRFIKEKKRFPKLLVYCLLVIILVGAGLYWNNTHRTKIEDTTLIAVVAEPETLPAPMTDQLPAASDALPAPTDDTTTAADAQAAAQDPSMPVVVDVPAEAGTVTVSVTPDGQQTVNTTSE